MHWNSWSHVGGMSLIWLALVAGIGLAIYLATRSARSTLASGRQDGRKQRLGCCEMGGDSPSD